jgi:hypothetical protein
LVSGVEKIGPAASGAAMVWEAGVTARALAAAVATRMAAAKVAAV